MKITAPKDAPAPQPITRAGLSKIRSNWLFQVTMLVAAFLAGMLVFRSGILRPVYTQLKHFVTQGGAAQLFVSPIDEAIEIVVDEVRMYQNNGLPTLYIDMPFESYQQLLVKRDEAVKLGILFTSDEDFVPATVQLQDGQKLDADIRLKGDWTDHLQGDKWSFRIELKEDGEILHTRKFSIQSPATREYLREWAFHQNLMREGVLTTRYEFVNVMLNGKLLGVYAFEENFATELMESQGRRAGVIIRFDEDLFWQNTANFWSRGLTGKGTFLTTEAASAAISPFMASKIAQDPVLSAEAQTAQNLLRAYQTGELPAEQVFDLPLMGRFFALSDLWSACHGTFWHNIRFYYNPITALLEPVGYDNEPFQWCDQNHTIVSSFINKSLFDDPAIRAAYAAELARVARPEYVAQLQSDLQERHDALSAALKIEFPHEDILVDWTKLNNRAVTLTQEINPPATVRGSYTLQGVGLESSQPPSLQLNLINLMILPVEVTRVEINGKEVGSSTLPQILPMVNDPSEDKFFPVQISINLYDIELTTGELPEVVVFTRLVGLEEEIPVALSGAQLPDSMQVGAAPVQPTLQEVLDAHPFLKRIPDEASRLIISQGNWAVRGDLILPIDTDLIIPPGVTLRFEPGAILYLNGSLHIKGAESQPVVLTAQDEVQGWGGIVVSNAPHSSNWEYAIVERTAGIERGGWILTGGITFFQSDVNLKHVFIGRNFTEDAINVVHGKFNFVDSEFAFTQADAFDSDFSEGTITNCSFHDIPGDAVDVSGTTAVIDGARMVRIQDKGVSVGEQSTVTLQGVVMEDVNIGVSSKDLSKTTLLGTTINNAHFAALAAYIKKPVYGPAFIEAPDIIITNTETEAIAQTGSTILLRGNAVQTVDMDVDRLYSEQLLGN